MSAGENWWEESDGRLVVNDANEAVLELHAEVERLRVKLAAAHAVCAERERELLKLKGPCSTDNCPLHYAHAGPCDVKGSRRGGNR